LKKNITYQPGRADGNQKINRKEQNMKRTLLIIAALMLSTSMVWADAVTGGTPVTHNVTLTITIPARLGISIPVHNHALDLALDLTYPPAVSTPYTVINNAAIQILSNNPYTYRYTASMTTTLTNLTVGDFQYSENGWVPPTWTGWQTFLAAGTFETSAAATAGWVNRNLNYRVNLDGTEAPGTGVMTIVHTITQP
jgi:hypothetical protein